MSEQEQILNRNPHLGGGQSWGGQRVLGAATHERSPAVGGMSLEWAQAVDNN